MVSIVIPTYNRSETIRRAIDSVLNQTFSDLELIIVDDCSTDNTQKVIEAYKDQRIRYIKNEKNSGACVSRNRGIEVAKGEYICFQDSDDFWRSDKLERQLSAFSNTSTDVCFGRFQLHGYEEAEGKIEPSIASGFIPYDVLISHNIVGTITLMAKKEVFQEFLFDESIRRLQDYDWVIRASEKYKFFLIDNVVADAYLQKDSITNAIKYEKAIDDLIAKYKLLKKDKVVAVMLNKKANIQSYNRKDASQLYMEAYRLTGEREYFLKAILSKLRLLKIVFKMKGLTY